MIFEVCVDTIESALAAQAGGATRLELCSALSEGGLTPSLGLVEVVLESVALPVNAMLRPRRGDFTYTQAEFDVLLRDLYNMKKAGVHGFVAGFLTPDGNVDVPRVKQVVEAAAPLEMTFHRAFDWCADPYQALEELISAGVRRILTAGQQSSAAAGLDMIAALTIRAAGRISIMPGAGISPQNIHQILTISQASEVHFSASQWVEGPMTYRKPDIPMDSNPDYSGYTQKITTMAKVKELISRAR
jgi:copper homeostasis protein